MSRKSSISTPTVISGYLYTNDPATTGIKLDSPNWLAWLEENASFYFEHEAAGFSVRRQKHRKGYYWYGYKRISGRLYKLYLGMQSAVTPEKLAALAHRYAEIGRQS